MQPISVLIIDKEVEFTSILTDRLNSWGFRASATNSGEDALAMLETLLPDVAVLGLTAPDTKRFTLLRMLRDRVPGIEVILLTGKKNTLAAIKGIEQGAFDILPQPVELGLLIDCIRKAYAAGHRQ
jgi:DNA-binding NtrC family response regulator